MICTVTQDRALQLQSPGPRCAPRSPSRARCSGVPLKLWAVALADMFPGLEFLCCHEVTSLLKQLACAFKIHLPMTLLLAGTYLLQSSASLHPLHVSAIPAQKHVTLLNKVPARQADKFYVVLLLQGCSRAHQALASTGSSCVTRRSSSFGPACSKLTLLGSTESAYNAAKHNV